jgi:uncharacterized membrane protein (UPF0127 family)
MNIGLPIVELMIGNYTIQAEVAEALKERKLGLMNRTSMPADSGMLFVFEKDQKDCFWMRDTKFPLSIAFITVDGNIANIEEMQAGSTDSHCPKVPVRYALEMNTQWFSEREILAGAMVDGLPKR